ASAAWAARHGGGARSTGRALGATVPGAAVTTPPPRSWVRWRGTAHSCRPPCALRFENRSVVRLAPPSRTFELSPDFPTEHTVACWTVKCTGRWPPVRRDVGTGHEAPYLQGRAGERARKRSENRAPGRGRRRRPRGGGGDPHPGGIPRRGCTR